MNESDDKVDLALADLPESCADGYKKNASENLRCSTCAPNFAPVEGGRCEECTGGSGGSAALVVLAIFLAVILFTILVALKMRSSGSKKAEHSTMKRTLLTHLQMLSIVMSLTVPWPVAVRNILTFVSSITSISAQASSIQCTTTGEGLTHATIFYITLTCSVLLPFAMMLVTFVYWFVCVPRYKVLSCGRKLRRSPLCPDRNPFRGQQQQQQQQQQQAHSSVQSTLESGAASAASVTPTRNSVIHSTRDGWIVTNVLLVYTITPSIVKSCFQMLQSETVCQINYWSLDDTITFDNASHQNMIRFVAVPSLLFYGVVCPLLVMFYIRRHHDRQTNRKLMFRFGLLYSGFAPKYWFYELILFLRKLLIILVVTFASSNEQQLHIALGVLIVLLYLLEHLRPYAAKGAGSEDQLTQARLHRMESLSVVILIGMVWSAVFFVIGCNDDDGTCSALGVGVLGSNVIFALGCGYTVAKAFQQKNGIGVKLNKLSQRLSRKISRGNTRGSSTSRESTGGQSQSGRDGDDEFHFETEIGGGEEDDEIGCTVKINPLAGAATRREFASRRTSSVQRRQVVGSSGSGSTNDSSNAATTAITELEMTSMNGNKNGSNNKDGTTRANNKSKAGAKRKHGRRPSAVPKAMPGSVPTPKGSFSNVHLDPNTGRRYSIDSVTQKRKWLDEDREEEDSVVAVAKASTAAEIGSEQTAIKRGSSFHAHMAEDGSQYYEDEETGETTWDLPSDATVTENEAE